MTEIQYHASDPTQAELGIDATFTQDDFEAALPTIAEGSVASHEYTQDDAIAAIKANMK